MAVDPNFPLDNVPWFALTTWHSGIAEGAGPARRYPVEAAPFGGIEDTSAASFAALGALLRPGESVRIRLPEDVVPPPGLAVCERVHINQMVPSVLGYAGIGRAGTGRAGGGRRAIKQHVIPLGAGDVPEMMVLAAIAEPGPFGVRTHELGQYLGIRLGGRLVAMAGERMRFPGHTEISAVCTHPDHRGQGYGRDLVDALVHRIAERGDMPFLHYQAGNPAAGFYERLGFALRRRLPVASLKKSA
ncbi:MAG TPA: GNAT family N-acetyltransferase [Dongiaceae bacterium]|nr:GNAT family N-acetyltransferase [Dongiaceae bacterium]